MTRRSARNTSPSETGPLTPQLPVFQPTWTLWWRHGRIPLSSLNGHICPVNRPDFPYVHQEFPTASALTSSGFRASRPQATATG